MDSSNVIIGGGMAGGTAARTLRDEGYSGRLVLIGDEPRVPYERPPLSKDVLRREVPDSDVDVVEPDFYSKNDIELKTGTAATAIDTAAQQVHTSQETIPYSRLLLATGSESRRLDLPGSDLAGVHYLRSFDEMAALRSRLENTKHLAVVGAGWIGSEVAASARQLGVDVTMIDMASVALQAVVGEQIGAVFSRLHADHGVKQVMNADVKGFAGTDRVSGVRTADDVIEADTVLIGIGAVPRTELARSAGLDVGRGITVDTTLQTSVPGVYAAGDVAAVRRNDLGMDLRVEHWATALTQGETAAKNMLGTGEQYHKVPYFFSDQYDLGLEYYGYPITWDRVVTRGDTAKREFIAFWLAGSRVTAAMNVNIWDVNDTLQTLIASGRDVDDARLADENVALEDL